MSFASVEDEYTQVKPGFTEPRIRTALVFASYIRTQTGPDHTRAFMNYTARAAHYLHRAQPGTRAEHVLPSSAAEIERDLGVAERYAVMADTMQQVWDKWSPTPMAR